MPRNDRRVAEYWTRDSRLGFDAGAVFGQWGELRLGPVWRQVHADVQTGDPVLPDVKANVSGMRISLFGDRMDNPWFPREGHRFTLSAVATSKPMGADSEYSRGELSWVQAWSFGAHTVQGSLYGGTNFGTSLPAYDAFVLGGPFRLSAYAIN